jgi:diaminohydroxyphosphoribosylaminopyrimidine deaminase/5-amino-6-(5-phosphoribosylamino)uracil reductase
MDGVMVGTGTALADDPALTVRHVEGRTPIRIALDRQGRLSTSLQLFSDDHAAFTVVFSAHDAALPYEEILVGRGGRIIRVEESGGHLDLTAVLERLGEEGGMDGRPLQSILVEGGAQLARSLFQRDLVDRYYLYIAPKIFGSGPLALDARELVSDEDPFVEHEWEIVGDDVLFRGYRREI